MTDTPPSDGPSQGAEFDMMGALDWKDGIATLPGSDIRVHVFLWSCFYSNIVPFKSNRSSVSDFVTTKVKGLHWYLF